MTWSKWIAIKRYRWALFRHALREPTLAKIASSTTFSRSIGKTREERNKNLRLMGDRWDAKGPKPEDFGLQQDDLA